MDARGSSASLWGELITPYQSQTANEHAMWLRIAFSTLPGVCMATIAAFWSILDPGYRTFLIAWAMANASGAGVFAYLILRMTRDRGVSRLLLGVWALSLLGLVGLIWARLNPSYVAIVIIPLSLVLLTIGVVIGFVSLAASAISANQKKKVL
jgi:hypothetical protein